MIDDDYLDDGRDERGRFRKGYSGNYEGRPRKKTPLSETDPYVFAYTLITVDTGAGPVQMTRREAVEQRLFQMAMKGGVTAIRELRKTFAQLDEMLAYARIRLDALEAEWIFEKKTEPMPKSVELKMMTLRSALNHGETPRPAWRDNPEFRRRFDEIMRGVGRTRPAPEPGDENESP